MDLPTSTHGWPSEGVGQTSNLVLIYVDHSMVFNLGYVQTNNRRRQKMQAYCWQFQSPSPCKCGGAMWGTTLPDGAHPGLH